MSRDDRQPDLPDGDRGCLRCREHDSLCEVIHSLHARVVALEQRVAAAERLSEDDEHEQG